MWLLLALAAYLPLGIIVFLLLRNQRERRARSRTPFEHLRRRPAGETLRIKIAELDEKIAELLALCVVIPAMVLGLIWFKRDSGLLANIPALFPAWIAMVIIGRNST